MFYSVLSVLIIILGLVAVMASLKILVKKGWVLGWIRGMFGLTLVALGIVMAMSAFDIFTYKQIVEEKSVATISFEALAPQRFNALLADSDGKERRFELTGDQWQLDARILKWPNWMMAVGVKPGYRLDRISGRYYSLEKERISERSVYGLYEDGFGIDVWQALHDSGRSINLVDAIYGNATYVPMADGALYEVRISNTGLLARPLNESAREALRQWE